MILLLSTTAGDASFPGIIDWLDYYGAEYYILNGEDIFSGKEEFEVLFENSSVNIKFKNFDINKVRVVYSRRWLNKKEFQNHFLNDEKLNHDLFNSLKGEFYTLSNYLISKLKNAFWIPSKNKVAVNKLFILETAAKIGFKIPMTLVTSQKCELENFWKLHNGNIISKAIDNFKIYNFEGNNYIQPMFTKRIELKYFKKLKSQFFPTLFQQYIDKQTEYRIFYFEKKIYTTIILSQENEKTKIDSRQSSSLHDSPRMMPYILPRKINSMIHKFMNEIEMNIGSIDLLQDNNGEFFFLEINPVGQFEAYSRYSNYNISKDLVKFMIEKDYER